MPNIKKMLTPNTNEIDDITGNLVDNTIYSDINTLYPEGYPKTGDGVDPNWFCDAYKGSTGFSELDTINQYMTNESMFEEIGEMMIGIALVEMKHLDKLGDLIVHLGGNVTQENNTSNIRYGETAREAVQIGMQGEINTIMGYEELMKKILALPKNETTKYALDLLKKLIADEKIHLKLFREWLKEN